VVSRCYAHSSPFWSVADLAAARHSTCRTPRAPRATSCAAGVAHRSDRRSTYVESAVHALYYWRPDNYLRDRRFGFGYHLNQSSPALRHVGAGERIWAFTRNRRGHYVLAADLAVRAVTRNPPNYRYGRYRVWGDLGATRYFETEIAPSAETLIRNLSVTTRAARLGQAFQGNAAVRPLEASDHEILTTFAADLSVIPSGGIFPEDEFEARLLLGVDAVERLLDETERRHAERTRYLYESTDITRARRHVEWLQHTYGGCCQICGFDPKNRYGRRVCHGHHVQWLSRGGDDELENMVLVCPNHHAAIHADDASFDYAKLRFSFANGLHEPLTINQHLPRAA
jgi:5-methylcytosine-specific restriction enzyme A